MPQVSDGQPAADAAAEYDRTEEAAGDARADAKGILIIMVTAIAFAMHFVSGWKPDF